VAEALGAPPPELVHIPTDVLVPLSAGRAAICGENFQFNNIFDNGKARADLGFAYTVPWVAGVLRMAAWLDARGRVQDSDLDPFEDRLIARWRQMTAL
jgi:nucleoside-diphosphate-sugar epimerase